MLDTPERRIKRFKDDKDIQSKLIQQLLRESSQQKARIKELESAKLRDINEYDFKIQCNDIEDNYIVGEFLYLKKKYMISIFDSVCDRKIFFVLLADQIQTIVTTLQKVLDDEVLK